LAITIRGPADPGRERYVLELRVLGELEVVRDGAPVMLPPSRKTRALLAYLALTRRTHRRERLCEIFWDVPDDPRGALRWSLSKIRPLVDDPGCSRLVADRQTVELLTEALDLDFFDAQACAGAEAPATGELARAASSFRGPLLADLDLPLNTEFHTWLVGLREDARKLQLQILRALTERLAATPQEALPYVRELVRIDPYDEAGWALLISNLAAVGRGGEARQQYEAATRILREVGGGSGPLLRAWRTAQASATRPADRDTTKTEPVAAEPIAARVAMTSSSAQPAPPPRASIVVLPFANLSNDPEQQYFADGITGNLTTDLSRIPDMLVISRNTAFTYRNKPVDTKQIGRELGVRYVLEGEVQRSASRVRVTAQLIDAETDVHLWAERFDGDAGDLFALQDEITNRIAVALDLELVGAEAMRPTVNRDTQDYILRGRAVRLKPPSRENRAEAVALFERALSLDQDSAAAQSWLAIALTARALDSMADTAAADIARGRLGRAGLGRGAAQLGRAFRQRSGATGAAAARRGHPRIRDRHRAQPQLGPLILPSRLVQVHDRVD
jgi:TolB-like protein